MNFRRLLEWSLLHHFQPPEGGELFAMNEPREFSRNWVFPRCLVVLLEDETINAEEFVLLGKINALVDPDKGGCWASNGWLAKWWNKTPEWVSASLSKFRKMGLVSIEVEAGKSRIIKPLFQVESLTKHPPTDPPRKLGDPPPRKLGGSNNSSHHTKYDAHRYTSKTGDTPRVRSVSRAASFGLSGNGEDTHSGGCLELCHEFADILISQNFHLGRKRPNMIKWGHALGDFIDKLNGDFERVARVLRWYQKNIRSDWLPTVLAIPTFCEKFFQIEKAMHRAIGDTQIRQAPKIIAKVRRFSGSEDEWSRITAER